MSVGGEGENILFRFHNDTCADLHNDITTVSGAELPLGTRSGFVD